MQYWTEIDLYQLLIKKQFPDFVWKVYRKFKILVILYWFGGKMTKKQEIMKQSYNDFVYFGRTD